MSIPLSEYRPFRFAKMAVPVDVTEAAGDVQLLELSADLPAGEYAIGVSLVSSFTSANDQLSWWANGDFPSPTFLKESKVTGETQPVAYVFPQEWAGGVMTLNLNASVNGAGAADVVILSANISFERKGE